MGPTHDKLHKDSYVSGALVGVVVRQMSLAAGNIATTITTACKMRCAFHALGQRSVKLWASYNRPGSGMQPSSTTRSR